MICTLHSKCGHFPNPFKGDPCLTCDRGSNSVPVISRRAAHELLAAAEGFREAFVSLMYGKQKTRTAALNKLDEAIANAKGSP